ncbi:MAG TPA: hypothetical protein VFN74_21830, partial [Chloroflexota bacterium]|nr:hypothetical protein [Chloroflexota bacterium]
QLQVLLYEQFLHPGGQIPAYEWEFSDTNPPVHAWAVWRVYNMDRIRNGKADRDFLELCFHKLLINFAWWVNKVDRNGNNVFEGGFLGLDNITVVDRSAPLPGGATLEQSDATGWMGMFCLNMMRMALELARENPVYEGLAIKFFQHFVYLGAAIKQMGYELWDEQDGFFYDVLHHADGRREAFHVRSLVGLIPLYAVERLERDWIEPFKDFRQNLDWLIANRPDLTQHCIGTIERDGKVVHILTLVQRDQLVRILSRVSDEREFLSPYGLRSLSKAHETVPFVFEGHTVRYEPAESSEKLKGGNSNWRGPIWFPTAFLLIEALRKLGTAYGQDVTVTDDDDGPVLTFWELAEELARRMTHIFLKDENGRRAVNGSVEIAHTDPHWQDLISYYEYFHGDTGAGLGASHQTGWSALVASLIDEWRRAPQGAALRVRLRQRQENGHRRAASDANSTGQLDATAVGLDEVLHDREAQPGAAAGP